IIMHLRLVLLVAFPVSFTIAERARNDRRSAINDDDDDNIIDAEQEFSECEDNEDVVADEDEQEVVEALKLAGVMSAFYSPMIYRWGTTTVEVEQEVVDEPEPTVVAVTKPALVL
ncbi:unnamed protein product, partial [Didymodactylos carnosus]